MLLSSPFISFLGFAFDRESEWRRPRGQLWGADGEGKEERNLHKNKPKRLSFLPVKTRQQKVIVLMYIWEMSACFIAPVDDARTMVQCRRLHEKLQGSSTSERQTNFTLSHAWRNGIRVNSFHWKLSLFIQVDDSKSESQDESSSLYDIKTRIAILLILVFGLHHCWVAITQSGFICLCN